MLALLTGMRFGEIVNLRWEDIDYTGKTITLEETKNGERRILPLTSAVEKCLLYAVKQILKMVSYLNPAVQLIDLVW